MVRSPDGDTNFYIVARILQRDYIYLLVIRLDYVVLTSKD